MRRISDFIRDRNPLILSPNTTVQRACQRMREFGVGAALVASENGELKGIFTRGDAINRVLAEGKSALKTTLDQVMRLTSARSRPPRRRLKRFASWKIVPFGICP